ncbi:ATP-dependent DNA helicase [Clostridium sediminicola]|uniref:ATP-dependent DNA helicase n=1 Tax=Clostridium sediminicola TaxID=3114879 RepID=UPI0031F1F6EC
MVVSNDTIKISVRNLVEFILKSGDLTSTFVGSSRMLEGTKAHQKIQKSAGENYKSEVHLKHILNRDDIKIEVAGRADGIIINDDEIIIDEIKSTTKPLEYLEEDFNIKHWAQAKCYGYFYCLDNELDKISIQITYYNIETKGIKHFKKEYSIDALKEDFDYLINSYIKWAKTLKEWMKKRDKSIEILKFPFEDFRDGQRKLSVCTYKTIEEGETLFAQAPTGIGKTVATIFPSIKAMQKGFTSKVFYLTAKTITRTAAVKAYELMKENGLRFKVLTITAKEKICFNDEVNCDPEKCKYAKGHFDRVNEAIFEIYNEENISRENIEKYAKKYCVCPFEFSLDLAFWADGIICDYNYVFDPRVHLKRLFGDDGSDYVFLVDEAHNLVDRAREMFSAELFKKEILELKKLCKEEAKELTSILNKINSYFVKLRKLCEEKGKYITDNECPKELISLLIKFTNKAEKWLVENNNCKEELKKGVLEIYFNALTFIRTSEMYDEKFITYEELIPNNDVKLKLYCMDPSTLLKDAMGRGKATILFSATLTPMDYFLDLLGGNENSYRVKLKSPFKRENLSVLIDGKTSTKYRNREYTYGKIADNIFSVIKQKKGNYLVFFPSYKYMDNVFLNFKERYEKINIICQSIGMSEEERENFLNKFKNDNDNSLVAFAVMGGIFGEGIDLAGDRLLGAIIVGVALPQICFERDIIKDYFNEKNGFGFDYSYVYPGMNKVMQAVGRVIRTEEDKGVALLIDDRFTSNKYTKLFPYEWNHFYKIKKRQDIDVFLKNFWEKVDMRT